MTRPVLLAIFALSLSLSLWFNFAWMPFSNAGVADGAEYLRDAKALGHMLNHDLSFFLTPSPELNLEIASLKGFKQAGVVFPGCILLSWLMTGAPHEVTSWQAPVLGQCILAAVACIFAALTGKLLWGAKAGIACGILSALYPAYIVNSGRLYSEYFSQALACFIMYTMCRGYLGIKRGRLEMLVLGLNLVMLHLTRSLMVILSFLAYPITFFQDRKNKPWQKLIFIFLGMLVVLVPWLFLQKVVLGKMSVAVDRTGNYNLFIGTNAEIEGWLSYPYPDCTNIESKPVTAIFKDAVKQGRMRLPLLMMDKPYRFFKYPWNDFRTAIGPISYYWQVLFHQLILVLSAVGICLALFRNWDGSSPSKGARDARGFVLSYWIWHSIYFWFITVPRYGLTAVPAMILFAGAGVACLLDLSARDRKKFAVLVLTAAVMLMAVRLNEIGTLMQLFGNQTAAVSFLCFLKLCFATVFFFVLYQCFPPPSPQDRFARPVFLLTAVCTIFLVMFPARANGRLSEWQCSLSRMGDSACQEIVWADGKSADWRAKRIFLLLDTDGSSALMQEGRIKVNGVAIDSPLIPGISLLQNFSDLKDQNKDKLYLECEWIFDCMAKPATMGADDVRQWFWVELPPAVQRSIVDTRRAKIEIENVSGRRAIRLFGNYLSKKQAAMAPSIDSTSWEKAFYGVESDRGFTDSRFDLKTNFAAHENPSFHSHGSVDSRDLSPSAGLQNGSYSMLLAAVPDQPSVASPLVSLPVPKTLHMDATAKEHFLAKVSYRGNPELSELWLVCLKGRSYSKEKPLTVSPDLKVLIDGKSADKFVYPCRWMPYQLPAGKDSVPFNYCFPLMPSELPGKISAIDISLKGLSDGSLDIDDLSVEIRTLPRNPLPNRCAIY